MALLLTERFTPPPADLMAAMTRACPEVASDIRAYWNQPVVEYAGHLFRPVAPPRSRIGAAARDIVRTTLESRARASLPPGRADAAMAGFDTSPVIQAGVHAQLLLDTVSFNAFLLGWIGARRADLPALFVFTGTTVTMETLGKEGPGWVDLGNQQINLFGMGRHKLCRQSVCGAGPVSLNRKALEAAYTENARPGWVDVLLANGDKSFGNAADAMASLNGQLIDHWDSACSTQPVFFDDRHAALALARHLEQPNGLVTRLLTDAGRRNRLEEALATAARGPYGRFLPGGTAHLWGIREQRVRKLDIDGDRLREAGRPQGVSVPLERAALRDGLLHGILLPNLFFLFLLMSLLPRVRVLGGFRQIGYVPMFQSVLLDSLDRDNPDERELAEDLLQTENAWGMRVIEDANPLRDQVNGGPATDNLQSLYGRYGSVTLAEAADGLQSFYGSNRWRRLVGLRPTSR